MAPIPRRPPRLVSDLARGNTIAYLGDSITNDTNAGWMGPREYHHWATLLSGGHLQWAGKFGQSGMGYLRPGGASADGMVFETAIAGVLALDPRPAKCCVLLGGNDFASGGFSVAQTIAAAKVAFNRLRAVGIEPVLLTSTPRNDLSGSATLNAKWHTYNQWLSRYGRLNGYQVIDLYSGLVDWSTGGWQSGHNRDTIHPSAAGAKAMGQLVADALTGPRAWTPYLTCDKNDGTAPVNSLMANDVLTFSPTFQTAADGIPDGWGCSSVPSGVTTDNPDAGNDAEGHWLHVTRSGATGGMTIRQANKVAAVPGDVLAMGFRFKLSSSVGLMQTQISFTQFSGTSYTASSVGNLWVPVTATLGQEVDIDPATYWFECPVTAAGTVAVGCDIFTSTDDGELWLGQFTLRNLTTLGVA